MLVIKKRMEFFYGQGQLPGYLKPRGDSGKMYSLHKYLLSSYYVAGTC